MYKMNRSKEGRRLAAVGLVAAISVNAALMGALFGLFDSASDVRWLADNGSAATLLQDCTRQPHTTARHACLREVVTAVDRRASGVAIARSDSDGITHTPREAVKP